MIPTTSLLRAVALAAIAACAAACASTDDENGSPGNRGPNDAESAVLAESVQIARVDRSTVNKDGKVRYYVDNISGSDQEDLAWSVSFVFPRGESSSEISVSAEEETTAEKSLILLRGERNKVLEAECGAFAERRSRGQSVIGTRLNMIPNPPVLTLARAPDGSPGTRFLGRIECVGQSSIWDGDQLVLEFENVSGGKVTNLELQVVFVDTRAKSKWRAIPPLAPGQRGKVAVDLKGIDMGERSFLVKVRQQAL